MCIQDGVCPLYIASHEGHDKTVEILLQAGATVDLQNKVEIIICYYGKMVYVQPWVMLMALHAFCETSTSIDDLTSVLVHVYVILIQHLVYLTNPQLLVFGVKQNM